MKPRLWLGKTNGGGRAQRALQFFFRFFGIRIGYFFAALALPFFMIVNRKGYLAIYNYAHRILRKNKRQSFAFVFLNHYRFAQCMLDRAALSAGRSSVVSHEFVNKEILNQVVKSDSSAIIGSVHLGNFELVPCLIPEKTKLIRPVIFTEDDKILKKLRPIDKAELQMKAIEIQDNMSHILEIYQAIKNGDIISMTVDRMYERMKSLPVSVCGQQARVPAGAFHLAVQFDLPMMALIAIRDQARHYKIFVHAIELTEEERLLEPTQKLQCLCNKFWKKIEEYIKIYPEQWYNFFPFWEADRNGFSE